MRTGDLTREELLREYLHTWPRHRGRLSAAAQILGYRPASLERRLQRMRRDGFQVWYTMDVRKDAA